MKRVLAIAACAAWLSTASSASADGGPVTPSWDAKIAVPGSSVTYRVRAVGRGTAVAELQRDTGAVEQSRRIAGRFGLAGAAYDGSTTGLSADGATLVLAQLGLPRPHERTHLAVLDARSLSVRTRIALPGFETVDAISPSGRWLYLIHYRDTVGLHYEVRAYDLRAGHLLRKAVADPEDRGEPMQGVPLTRTVSADGRWDYTLYLRANGRPFVHVLDTERVAAVCVDLPAAVGSALSDPRLVLGPGGRTVAVQNRGRVLAVVNTTTFAVQLRTLPSPSREGTSGLVQLPQPSARSVAHAAVPASPGADPATSIPWPLIAVLVIVLSAAALLLWRRRHGRRAVSPVPSELPVARFTQR